MSILKKHIRSLFRRVLGGWLLESRWLRLLLGVWLWELGSLLGLLD
jgi:hypothetical protein